MRLSRALSDGFHTTAHCNRADIVRFGKKEGLLEKICASPKAARHHHVMEPGCEFRSAVSQCSFQ